MIVTASFILVLSVDDRGSDIKTDASNLHAGDLVHDIATTSRGLSGGYLLETDGRPWNAFVNESEQIVRYCVEDFSSAQDMLRAVVEFAETGSKVSFFFWEYSDAEIDAAGAGYARLVDYGIAPSTEQPVFPAITVEERVLLAEMSKATASYLRLARGMTAEAQRMIESGLEGAAGDLLTRTVDSLEIAAWERLLSRLEQARRSERRRT